MNLNKLVKSTVLSLSACAGVALAAGSQAQTIEFVGGGSSALLGNFQPASYFPGAIPQAIAVKETIGGYKGLGDVERVLVIKSQDGQADYTSLAAIPNAANDVIAYRPASGSTPALYEVVGDAMVRYSVTPVTSGSTSASDTLKKVLILLRSDSGQGVRYVANNMSIYQIPNAAFTAEASSYSSNQFDSTVLTYLRGKATGTGSSTIKIDVGLSDVAADTVFRYGNFNIGPINNTFTGTPLAVQTLLPLYSNLVHTNAGSDFQVNISRHLAENITAGAQGPTTGKPITWNNVDSRFKATDFVNSLYRENSSGTRMTYVVDILRSSLATNGYLTENEFGQTIPNGNPQLGTGAMVNKLQSNTATFYGYSFVTGTTGNSKGNVRAAAYNGVLAYPSADATKSASLPGNNGQAAYSTATTASYYTEVVNGRYELWSVANGFVANSAGQGTPSADLSDIVAGFSGTNAAIGHGLGFTFVGSFLPSAASPSISIEGDSVFRTAYPSALTGEFVTDGGLINYDAAGTSIPQGILQ